MITKKSKILITGCGGMLGDAVYSVCCKICNVSATDINVNTEWLSYLDVRDYQAIEKQILEFKPTAVFHLAALTDLEYCETHPDEAYKTNAFGTENVALLCKKYNILMVYISTAGVFDGLHDVYNDYAIPNPISHYGKSKYAGTQFVQSCLDRYFIFRPGWMMGGGPTKDKKFVKKIIDLINSGKKELLIVNDKLGTPTYTYDFAKNIIEVINSNLYGLYNMVCNGESSRYEIAEEILKILKLETKIKLTEVSSDYFRKEYFAPRPYSERLINLKLNFCGLNKMRDWKVCLREYLSKFKWLK
ncbi:MAG: NAD(P)-dependent oxidoreductase [Elusimicrobiota bacterium]